MVFTQRSFLFFLPVFVFTSAELCPLLMFCDQYLAFGLLYSWPFCTPPLISLWLHCTSEKQNTIRHERATELFLPGAREGTSGGGIWAGPKDSVHWLCGVGVWGWEERAHTERIAWCAKYLSMALGRKNHCLNYSNVESTALIYCSRDIFPYIREWVVSFGGLEFFFLFSR